jgi:hypothetical protein
MLQIADLVTGSMGDFFTWALKDAPRKRVDRFFTKLLPLFHRQPDGSIIPWGLCANTSNNDLIATKLKELTDTPTPGAPTLRQ